jgi:NAD(P)-dependent dehydrogenase (short-subunit alcohol dehydrogenase family)
MPPPSSSAVVAEWARVVNFSAHSTQRQSIRLPAYTAAKAMVNSVSKNLSLLLAPDERLHLRASSAEPPRRPPKALP